MAPGGVRVAEVQPAAGWQAGETREAGGAVRIDFTTSDEREVRFEAEVERDRTLDVDVTEPRAQWEDFVLESVTRPLQLTH